MPCRRRVHALHRARKIGSEEGTDACRAFLTSGEWPEGLWEEEVAALHELETRTAKRFGDPANPCSFIPPPAETASCPLATEPVRPRPTRRPIPWPGW